MPVHSRNRPMVSEPSLTRKRSSATASAAGLDRFLSGLRLDGAIAPGGMFIADTFAPRSSDQVHGPAAQLLLEQELTAELLDDGVRDLVDVHAGAGRRRRWRGRRDGRGGGGARARRRRGGLGVRLSAEGGGGGGERDVGGDAAAAARRGGGPGRGEGDRLGAVDLG